MGRSSVCGVSSSRVSQLSVMVTKCDLKKKDLKEERLTSVHGSVHGLPAPSLLGPWRAGAGELLASRWL